MPLFARAANAYAEYLAAPSRQLARKAVKLDHAHAAAPPLSDLAKTAEAAGRRFAGVAVEPDYPPLERLAELVEAGKIRPLMFPVIALGISTVVEGYEWALSALLGLAAVLMGNLIVLTGKRENV